MSISFSSLIPSFKVKEPRRLREFVELICFTEEHECGDINFIFCNDKYLYNLNVKYLKHKTLTDIITFDYSLAPESSIHKAVKSNPKVMRWPERQSRVRHKISGDIFISIDRVMENAMVYKEPFNKELNRVMFHGVLHLCGYKDKSQRDIVIMRKKEAFYLELYNRP